MLFGEGQCVISTLFYHAMCSRGAMAVPDEEVEEVFKLFDQAAVNLTGSTARLWAAQKKG